MNLANGLTLARIILAPFFLLLISVPNIYTHYGALLVFTVACLTDLLDGHIARVRNQITNFGKFMDPLADKLLVVMGLISFAQLSLIPVWIAILIISREIFITGVRALCAYKGVFIFPTRLARAKTAVEMALVIICLLFTTTRTTFTSISVLDGYWREDYGLYITKGIFYLSLVALVLALVSGIHYIWKNKETLWGAAP
jgi:CDP-diacylglycerol--glycerol-3-phosphate 3-phosphatidyltransferase